MNTLKKTQEKLKKMMHHPHDWTDRIAEGYDKIVEEYR